MRMRRKPWARPELADWRYYIQEPAALIERWREEFGNQNPLHLELGCGKGTFVAEMAAQNPQINFIAVDIKSEVIVLAKRAVEAKADPNRPLNVRLMSHDIERITAMLSAEDQIQRIYINFCNPWPKNSYKKHRLTHTRQLISYKSFLVNGGEIWFKTDDLPLFEESIAYFKEAGFEITQLCYDLHNSQLPAQVETEHERMFISQGVPIKFLKAMKPI